MQLDVAMASITGLFSLGGVRLSSAVVILQWAKFWVSAKKSTTTAVLNPVI
jgi:hypothetical protein